MGLFIMVVILFMVVGACIAGNEEKKNWKHHMDRLAIGRIYGTIPKNPFCRKIAYLVVDMKNGYLKLERVLVDYEGVVYKLRGETESVTIKDFLNLVLNSSLGRKKEIGTFENEIETLAHYQKGDKLS